MGQCPIGLSGLHDGSDLGGYAIVLCAWIQGSWEWYLHLVEFSYNNSYQASILMAPNEACVGECRNSMYWTKLSESRIVGPNMMLEDEEKVWIIREKLKEVSDRQKSYVDLKRKEIEFNMGDKVFLKVSPWKKVLRSGKMASWLLVLSGHKRW